MLDLSLAGLAAIRLIVAWSGIVVAPPDSIIMPVGALHVVSAVVSYTRCEPQHFLNFLPLPQGQGSLRPMRRAGGSGGGSGFEDGAMRGKGCFVSLIRLIPGLFSIRQY